MSIPTTEAGMAYRRSVEEFEAAVASEASAEVALARAKAAKNKAAEMLHTAVLLVGEAPGRSRKEARHALLRRDLAELMGVSFPIGFYRLVARVNVLDRWPGRVSGGRRDAFPLREARDRAVDLVCDLWPRYRHVVLLGRRVESAFFPGETRQWFDWRNEREGDVPCWTAVAPHPSRVSHWWNDPEHVRRAGAFWRALAETARQHLARTT